MAQTVGIIDIVWNGVYLACEKGSKAKLGGIKNNPVTHGRKVSRAQEYQGSEITATVPFERGMKLSDIWTEGEGELQVRLDTGQTYVWNDAFLSGDRPEISEGEGGKVQLKWSGGTPEEVI
jgi:hypothetical protein